MAPRAARSASRRASGAVIVPVVGVVLELDLAAMQGPAGRGERNKRARPERRPVLLRIEDVDRDRTLDRRRVYARQHDQRVDAVERRAARDVDEMQRRVRCVGERCAERLRQQSGDLLHAQPDQRHVRGRRELAVHRTVEAGRQVVRAELQHVGRDAVEIVVVRRQDLAQQPRAPCPQPHEQPRDDPGHAAVATVPGQERIAPRREARGIVRNRECRMRDVDDRQAEAVGGGGEHEGAAVSDREMGLHDRFQIGRAATASRAPTRYVALLRASMSAEPARSR